MMEKQIYYHDTDAGGVVYYGRYLNYMEEARADFFTERGLNIELFRQKEFLYAVRKCTIVYKSPAVYGDIITCDAVLTKMTAAQFLFKQNIHNKITSRLIVEADVILVSLNKDFKPKPIPESIRKLLSPNP